MSTSTKNKKEFVSDILLSQDLTVSDEAVDYYIAHPEEIDLIIDKERTQSRFLWSIFTTSIVLMIGSRFLSYFFQDTWGEFINDFILDIVKEIGIAMLGGVITVYFIEVLQKKQYEQNIKYREELLNKIRERTKAK